MKWPSASAPRGPGLAPAHRTAARFLVIVAALAIASLSAAQMDMSAMARSLIEPSMAFLRPEIRKEVKTNKQQNSEIEKIEKEMQTRGRPSDPSADPFAPMERMKEADDKILALLDDTQKKRFAELQIQIQGPPALAYPEASVPVGLTSDQLSKVKQIQSQYSDAMMTDLMAKRGRTPLSKLRKMRDDRDASILQVLTPEQQEKFKQLQGTPFKDARPKDVFY